MIKILANDGIDESAKLKLEEKGYSVELGHYDKDELMLKIKEVDCIICRSATKIRHDLIDAATKTNQLKLIVRAGVGIDNIDYEYAEEKGITVQNTPNSSSAAVAELTIGHMFSIARNIYHANVSMREGKWLKKQYRGIELSGKTLGLVGFGRIARGVAKKAVALGMTVQYFDIKVDEEMIDGVKPVSKETLLKTSDFISLHIPFKKEYGPFLSVNEFNTMKNGMYIINIARGGVIDESALLDALDQGQVEKCALDVYEEEPLKDKRIYTHEKISLTPHIGAATFEAQKRIGEETIDVILNYLS
ncbi:MAG: D-2-hydroxyacid dehydrogenase [Candidatus Izimaplasma sp.]|nr:D-2-hydroxyacid dehydrogenase [Candidatus Izimaplasma bacterium]